MERHRLKIAASLAVEKRLETAADQNETQMPENDLASQTEQMLDSAMGGRTPHQVLIETSLAENANVAERAAAKAKNRERALKLLEAIEKSMG